MEGVIKLSVNLRVFETVLAFSLVVLLCILLRYLKIVRKDDGFVFSNLMTQAVLPAVIFEQLATHPIERRQVLMVLAMIIAGCVSLSVAWVAGTVMRIERAKIGALMITSTFGSSSLLGYPLVQYAFPNNSQAMADAILLSELGVGLPIFTLCPAIAMYFGEMSQKSNVIKKILIQYFRSPIFIALVLGLMASRLNIPIHEPFIAPFFEAFRMIEGALTILACLILSLQLNLGSVKGLLPLVVVSAAIQMGVEPFIAAYQADLFRLSTEQRHILVLISAMPSAVLGPVFATRFNCASETSSALVFINILLSLILIPSVFGTLAR